LICYITLDWSSVTLCIFCHGVNYYWLIQVLQRAKQTFTIFSSIFPLHINYLMNSRIIDPAFSFNRPTNTSSLMCVQISSFPAFQCTRVDDWFTLALCNGSSMYIVDLVLFTWVCAYWRVSKRANFAAAALKRLLSGAHSIMHFVHMLLIIAVIKSQPSEFIFMCFMAAHTVWTHFNPFSCVHFSYLNTLERGRN